MTNIQSIQRLSRFMQGVCVAVIGALPLLWLWLWVSFEQWLPAKARQLGMAVDVNALGLGTLTLTFICSLLPVLVLMYGLWRLRQLFGLYRHGCFFCRGQCRPFTGICAGAGDQCLALARSDSGAERDPDLA